MGTPYTVLVPILCSACRIQPCFFLDHPRAKAASAAKDIAFASSFSLAINTSNACQNFSTTLAGNPCVISPGHLPVVWCSSHAQKASGSSLSPFLATQLLKESKPPKGIVVLLVYSISARCDDTHNGIHHIK